MGGWSWSMTIRWSCSATWRTRSPTSEAVSPRQPGRARGAARKRRMKTINVTGSGDAPMYKTKDGEEIFVIDGHTHFWDASPANQKNVHGKQFIECFYAYHSNLSPPSEKWT